MKLYNTLTRHIDELRTLQTNTVKLYTCGLTVYSQPHIGNWLPYIYWDALVRTLRANGFTVEHTQNITDVGHLTSDDDNGEDKMEKGARAEGVTAWDVAKKYIAIAENEAEKLGLQPPTHLVRATSMIDQQIVFAKILDEKGFLYKIAGDGMYFDTAKLPEYGRLARLDIDGLEAGARVSVAGKRSITDFAVWKFSPPESTRDMEWESPWGTGFPGWHLECSVIARETLGDQIDIHCGGVDHIPVHHINEIAQTETVTGKPFSQFWIHNNHLKVEGGKMAKSKGNIYTLQNILDKGFSLDAYKVFSFGKHYRTEGNFTWDNLEAAANRLKHWQSVMDLRWQTPSASEPSDSIKMGIIDALSNDLDTPTALRLIDEEINGIEKRPTKSHIEYLGSVVSDLLGMSLLRPDVDEHQKSLIAQREQSRTAKDWAKSDKLRDLLVAEGIALNDTPAGVTWYWL